jgi:NAD(P)H-hydrate epimerase
MLGTGFRGVLEDNYLMAAETINKGRAYVLSVDIPSGINADTGEAAAEAVTADETVTFSYGKQGLYVYPGRRHSGIITVEDISLPQAAVELTDRVTEWVDAGLAASLLPETPTDSHKGSFGHVLAVAGSRGMTGAALLAARGALRSGAGMVTSAVPDSLSDGFDLAFAEGMTAALPESGAGRLSAEAGKEILTLAKDKGALLFGPGISRDGAVPQILEEVLSAWDKPTVLDAGGLWALAQNKDIAVAAAGPLILTPHPGELAMLLDVSVAEIQSDRITAVCKAAKDFGAVVVLKGASTLTADPEGSLYINSTGSPAMATAGSGDVLAGALAAWIARGLTPRDAAVLAVYIHGRAGDILNETYGDRGGLAGEIAENLPLALRELRKIRCGEYDGK